MGAIADAIVAYAQPLLDQTDGSVEEMNKALSLGTLCWNLAVQPKAAREVAIGELRQTLKLDDKELEAFRHEIIEPMIRRYEQMFPSHESRSFQAPTITPAPLTRPTTKAREEKYPGTQTYAPCPCNSGKKYKFCCRG